MDEEIVLNKELLKAIGADTRIAILKSLAQRRKTQSELAKELKLSTPTILEHMDQLAAAGLVELVDEGRKWKYCTLTKKGKRLVSPESRTPVNVVFMLTVSILLVVAAFYIWPMLNQDYADGIDYSAKSTSFVSQERAAPAQGMAFNETYDAMNETNKTRTNPYKP